jgi:hypothetical protein
VPAPAKLTDWPAPPEDFNPGESAAWNKLGRSLIAAGTVGEADLLFVEETARVMARRDHMAADPQVKVTTLAAYARLIKEHLIQLGLSPASRKTVSPLGEPEGTSGVKGLLDW